LRTKIVLIAVLCAGLGAARLAGQAGAVKLDVDAREAPRKLFHARLTIPAQPGPLTLLYPKWIPGEHGPTGPIADLAGLTFTAGGKVLAWRRDPVDMYAIQIEVPPGAQAVDVTLDLLSASESSGFSSGASATASLAVLSWNQVLLYPKGSKPDELVYAATLRLPSGWKYGTSLAHKSEKNGEVEFEPVSLTMLVDSPVLTGSHFRAIPLTDAPLPTRLNIAADSEAALDMSADQVQSYKNLVAETGALFGARHYRHYDFLLTLSDHTAHFGLEHHESSDDRVCERCVVNEDKRRADLSGLLPHEMTHSWNGKYRRPADLQPGTFDQPMHGDLLWVYEGLTEYLGEILTPRSGLLTAEQYRQSLAETAAEMEITRGRLWRPLQDTADAAQVLYDGRPDGALWRRGTDFYPESSLLWLEADTLIRQRTQGKRSLDDFCRLFHGEPSGPPRVVTYTFEDVVAALNQIVPYDWRTFWRARLDRLGQANTHAPTAGIEASGWRLVYRNQPTEMQRSAEEAHDAIDARFSIGIFVGRDGAIPEVVPDSPASRAGIGPGTAVVAVNGKRYSRDVLHDALKASASRPVELLLSSGDDFATYKIEYSGGERYPDLERDTSKPDLLSKIIAAHGK